MNDVINTLRSVQMQLQQCATDLGGVRFDTLEDVIGLSADDKADVFNCAYDIALSHSRLARLIERLATKDY